MHWFLGENLNKKAPRVVTGRFSNQQLIEGNYGFFVAAGAGAAVLAGFIALAAGAALAGLLAEFAGALAAGALAAGTFATGAGVVAAGVLTVTAFALFALFAGALVAASPQAIPRALNPRTVESTITFFILFKTPNLTSKNKHLFPGIG